MRGIVPLAMVALAAAALLTQTVRRLGLRHGLVDVPNERSSHARPTPRGGGVAVVAASTACFAVLWIERRLDTPLWAALAGGLAVAFIGLLDDRKPLPAAVRLAAHAGAALWAVVWLGGLPPLQFGATLASSGGLGYLLAVLGIIWAINLFNFMDGIDGIAASEAIFIALAGAALSLLMGVSPGVALAAGVFAAACGGFLLWNWPPARIFLGDVGSGYLGYVIVVLAVGAVRERPAALWVWLILGGSFFVDATVTLVRRVLRRERVHVAHRSHAYQQLARRWRSHRRVTLAVLIVNLVWFLPWALFAAKLPQHSAAVVLTAFVPLAVLAVLSGAGRDETESQEP
jgi:Fuc2NAc and GlcNAc transferase